MSTTYVVIITKAWMNKRGHGEDYTAPHPPVDTHSEAVSIGFEVAGCDDFNIGVLNNGVLTSLLWMNDDVGEEPAVLAKIAREIHRHRPEVRLP